MRCQARHAHNDKCKSLRNTHSAKLKMGFALFPTAM